MLGLKSTIDNFAWIQFCCHMGKGHTGKRELSGTLDFDYVDDPPLHGKDELSTSQGRNSPIVHRTHGPFGVAQR